MQPQRLMQMKEPARHEARLPPPSSGSKALLLVIPAGLCPAGLWPVDTLGKPQGRYRSVAEVAGRGRSHMGRHPPLRCCLASGSGRGPKPPLSLPLDLRCNPFQHTPSSAAPLCQLGLPPLTCKFGFIFQNQFQPFFHDSFLPP